MKRRATKLTSNYRREATKKMENQCKDIELKISNTLQNTLKQFQIIILSEVGRMVYNQIEIQITKQMQILNANMSNIML